MNEKLNIALNNIETNYTELVDIANDSLTSVFTSVDSLVNEIQNTITNITTPQIRDYILRLQLLSYALSATKEKAGMKSNLAESIKNEHYAIAFNSLEGSAAVKQQQATVNISEDIVADLLYELMANMLKTKLDEVHRLIDSLKSILMSRMQETKFLRSDKAIDDVSDQNSDDSSF